MAQELRYTQEQQQKLTQEQQQRLNMQQVMMMRLLEMPITQLEQNVQIARKLKIKAIFLLNITRILLKQH